ncbi:MAG TPA: polysaccharide deacetylase family protein [Myxococcaceae bacterium]|nr:polysaccharide deacetylase family protein [Myxococcaceae bacterium]
MRRAAVSVDLDGLVHYARIHGLAESALDARASSLHLELGLPRFLALFGRLGLPATFFVVGEDVGGPGTESLRAAARAGNELASHSHTHPYALARAEEEVVVQELERAEEALAAVAASRPVGFRSPGYTLSGPILRALLRRGYRYDASVFPAAPYYLTKALVLGAMAVAGRRSASVLDSPSVLLAPRCPYRPDPAAPYRRGDAALLELPMAVTPVMRLPFIGTLLTAAPWALVRRAYGALAREEFLSVELHAVDLLDAADGVPAALVRAQRDLSIPKERKEQRLAEVLTWLARDFTCTTLADAAAELGRH